MRGAPLLLLLCLPAAALGCAVRPGGSPPALVAARPDTLPDAFTVEGVRSADARWWTAFQDPVLDGLVERSLGANFSLRAARERVIRSAALARRAGSPLYPTLSGTASAGGIATRRDATPSAVTNTAEALSLGLAASWEIDLWGKLRATRDAAVLDARASCADLHAARLSTAALVATTWTRYAEESRIAALLQEQIATNEKLQTLIDARFQRGQGAAADVLRQQQLVERTRGNLSLTESRRAVLAHQLGTLQGLAATETPPPPPPELTELPPLPALGIPSETLTRRPDVQAAWWRVLAADRVLAAAIADRYPSVSLGANAALGGSGLEVFFLDRLASIAANLAAPIVDGGRRRAQVDADAALRRQLIDAYSETLLVALQEVEDALVGETKEREHFESLERQHTLAQRVVETLLTRYGQGAAPYLDVLAAVQSEQSLAVSLVSSRRALIEQRIALCRAIAGSWNESPPCTPCDGSEPE